MIDPELATPKVRVDTVITHPAVVSTPVLLGNKQFEHEIQRVNAVTGEVVGTDKVVVNKPIIGEVH